MVTGCQQYHTLSLRVGRIRQSMTSVFKVQGICLCVCVLACMCNCFVS